MEDRDAHIERLHEFVARNKHLRMVSDAAGETAVRNTGLIEPSVRALIEHGSTAGQNLLPHGEQSDEWTWDLPSHPLVVAGRKRLRTKIN